MKAIIILLFLVTFSFAEVGKVSSVIGDAQIQRSGKSLKVKIGTLLEKKDLIETKNNSKLQIIFKDNTIVTLGKNSKLDVSEYVFDLKNPKSSKTNLNFFKGAFKVITGKIGKINRDKFKLKTKSASIGIRGTVVLGNQNIVACTQGAITVESEGQSVFVNANELTFTKINEAPSSAETITSENLKKLNSALEPEEGEGTDNGEGSEESSNNNEEGSQTSNNQNESSSTSTADNIAQDVTNESNNDNTINEITTNSENDSSSSEGDNSSNSGTDNNSSSNGNNNNGTSSVTNNQNGFLLGANKSSTSSNNFIQTDSYFKAKLLNNSIYYFKDGVIQVSEDGSSRYIIKSEQTESLGTFDSSNYSGFPSSSIGSVAFNYTDNSLSGNYTLYADNLGEAFVGIYKSSTFNELFVTGVNYYGNNIDSDKTYVYKRVATLEAAKNSSSGKITNSALDDYSESEQTYDYYNAKTNSLTSYNPNYLSEGATQFVSGNKTSVKTYKSNYDGSDNAYEYIQSIDSDILFLGSDVQALAINTSLDLYNQYTSDTQTVSEKYSTLSAAYLDNNATSDAIDIDDEYTMKGFTSALIYEKDGSKNIQNSINANNFKLTFGKNNDGDYTVTGNLIQSIISINLNFYTDVNEETNETTPLTIGSENAYYINQDLFGVLAKSGSYDDASLVNNTGYLISVHDGGLDSNDNPVFLDDDSSWGYWTASYDDGEGGSVYIDTSSPWVAGVVNTDTISDLLTSANQTSATFEGQALGNVIIDSSVENILLNDDNVVSFSFDFGNSTNNLTAGSIKFKTTTTSWNLTLNSGATVDSSTGIFTTSDFNSASSSSTVSGVEDKIISSNVTGQLYGNESIKSVGGTFSMTDNNSNIAKGVYKATKK